MFLHFFSQTSFKHPSISPTLFWKEKPRNHIHVNHVALHRGANSEADFHFLYFLYFDIRASTHGFPSLTVSLACSAGWMPTPIYQHKLSLVGRAYSCIPPSHTAGGSKRDQGNGAKNASCMALRLICEEVSFPVILSYPFGRFPHENGNESQSTVAVYPTK